MNDHWKTKAYWTLYWYIRGTSVKSERYYSVTNWLFLYWPWYRFEVSSIVSEARRSDGQYYPYGPLIYPYGPGKIFIRPSYVPVRLLNKSVTNWLFLYWPWYSLNVECLWIYTTAYYHTCKPIYKNIKCLRSIYKYSVFLFVVYTLYIYISIIIHIHMQLCLHPSFHSVVYLKISYTYLRKNKDWLSRYQDNVSERSDMHEVYTNIVCSCSLYIPCTFISP
jgi:hypothetical protein